MKSSLLDQPAPEFAYETHDGRHVALADYKGKTVVVLYFYPMDGSPVCTKEACAFRDAYEDFSKAGAVVIGVSADAPDRHRAFAASNRLPFILVSDKDGALRKAYQVRKTLWLLPGRVTYVIDKAGVVRHVFDSLFSADQHIQEALAVVRRLASENDPTPGTP